MIDPADAAADTTADIDDNISAAVEALQVKKSAFEDFEFSRTAALAMDLFFFKARLQSAEAELAAERVAHQATRQRADRTTAAMAQWLVAETW